MPTRLLVLLLLAGCSGSPGMAEESPQPAEPVTQEEGADATPPPEPESPTTKMPREPFVFRIRGAPPEAVALAKTHPSYVVRDLPDGRIEVEWDPRVPKDWKALRENFSGKHYPDLLFDMVAIYGKVGKTKFERGGLGTFGWGGAAFSEVRHWLAAVINFTDLKAKLPGNSMFINGAIGPSPEEIRHEMLRNFIGTSLTVEKCGEGYVLVSESKGSMAVCWQISDQAFVKVEGYDKGMISAYVDRLGSLIPKDLKVDIDAWVRDEIRYRTMQIDWTIRKVGWKGHQMDASAAGITTTFPDVYKRIGLPGYDKTPQQYRDYFKWVREWLWANRDGFRYVYDNDRIGFFLQGPDLYDPKHPPELPEEMRGLPDPSYVPPSPPTKEQSPAKPSPPGTSP